jgi:pimeloyl-ACP methyl ester carboxylesterase
MSQMNRIEIRRRDIIELTVGGVAVSLVGMIADSSIAHAKVAKHFPITVPDGVQKTIKAPDGTELSTREYGNPKGPPILFIHGFSQCYLSWSKQITDPDLLKRYRLVTMDLRGHGCSDAPAGPYLPKTQADDVKAVIDRLNLDKVTLVGWSLGGVILLDYLHKHGISSSAGAVFVGSGTGDSSNQSQNFLGPALLANIPGMTGLDLKTNIVAPPSVIVNLAATRAFLSAVPKAPFSDADFTSALAYNMIVTPKSRLASISRVNAENPPQDYEKSVMPAMKAAGLRVLVVGGNEDKLVLHAASEFIALHTGGRLLSYQRTGHAPMLEQVERFNADLASFVG